MKQRKIHESTSEQIKTELSEKTRTQAGKPSANTVSEDERNTL